MLSLSPWYEVPSDTMLDLAAPPEGGSILVADDEASITRLLATLLARRGYAVTVAANGYEALTRIATQPPDLAILDINMGGVTGIEVCRHMRAESTTRLTPVIVLTGQVSHDLRLESIAAGANDFLMKPIDSVELLTRVRSLIQIKRYTDDLESAGAVMMTLAAMAEARDGYHEGHCHRMANYAVAIGQRLALREADSLVLRRGGFLHDIGMLAVPDAILRKATPLEPDEYDLVKAHTVMGERLVAPLRTLCHVAPIIRHHHERWDGSGYPDGLVGDAIPLLAQIIGVVDVFEALTSARAYQVPVSVDRALEILRDQVRRGWRRPDLVDHLVDAVHTRERHESDETAIPCRVAG